MTETPLTDMREKRRRWPGIVWAVPIIATTVVAYLGVRALSERGVDVVVTFDSVGGAQVGDTKVIYKGVEAGRVTKIRISPGGRSVDMTLRLPPEAKPVLREGAVFWLIGAKPSLTDVNSLRAALAGVSIGAAPGGGRPTRHFKGLMSEPAVLPGTPGRSFRLTTERIGPLKQDSGVYYQGLLVGKVTSIELNSPHSFRVGVFLREPYDRLVRLESQFWLTSPVQLSLTPQGLSAQLAPGNAALAGGLEFNTPRRVETQSPAPNGADFVLYPDRGSAIASGSGPQVAYDLNFKAGAAGLEEGSAVKLDGRQIGAVKDVGFSLDARTGEIFEPITVTIRPQRLNLRGVELPAGDNWRGVTDAAIAKLVARGYRAKIVQDPPLIGARSISLEQVHTLPAGRLRYASANTILPTTTASDVATLTDKADLILEKINQIPLSEIGGNVRRLTAKLDRIAGSPQVRNSLANLDSTLSQVDALVREVKPQVGPLVTKLNLAADQLAQTASSANALLSAEERGQDTTLPGAIRELTEAARSIRALTEYLGRHPEAVLRGKVKER